LCHGFPLEKSFPEQRPGRIYGALALLLVTYVGHVYLQNAGGPALLKDLWVYAFTDYMSEIRRLEEEYGVKVQHRIGPDFLAPEWRRPPVNGRVTEIGRLELSRYARLLREVLAQYPEKVLRQNLNAVYLSGSLELYGQQYGGTSIGRSIYLTSSGREEGFDDLYMEQLFHHEFSSILMRDYRLPVDEWLAANPPDFQYSTRIQEILHAIANNRETEGSEELYRQGMLTRYSTSTVENDVNVYAETVFTDPVRMKELTAEYPTVRKKYLLLKAFYLSIDRSFARVFDRIR